MDTQRNVAVGRIQAIQQMPSSTKLKRGAGLVLVGALGWLTVLLIAMNTELRGFPYTALGLTGLAAMGVVFAGIVLVIWGLFSD